MRSAASSPAGLRSAGFERPTGSESTEWPEPLSAPVGPFGRFSYLRGKAVRYVNVGIIEALEIFDAHSSRPAHKWIGLAGLPVS